MLLRFWKKRPANHPQRNSARLRRLRVESLERRELLAGDLFEGPSVAMQNEADPFDVDRSGRPVALDALLIANHLNGQKVAGVSLDVDGDGQVTTVDFDAVLYRLNLGTPAAADGPGMGKMSQGEAGGFGGGNGSGTKTSYKYWSVGSSKNCSTCIGDGGLALMGGGTDVDEVFRWMGDRANGGDFLVLLASGNGAYNSYINDLATLNSVATLVIPDRASAYDPFVATTIRQAEAVFVGGGDQANYINFWAGTPVESAIYEAMDCNKAVLGGTSAGLAVLGDYDFAALNGGIGSASALANPYDSRITLDGTFINSGDYVATVGGSTSLSLLDNTITDSHFEQRDRMGRLLTFLARLDADGLVTKGAERGIGVNEQTALLVDQTGSAHVVGNPYSKKLDPAVQQRSVYLLNATKPADSPLHSPLDFSRVDVIRANYDPISGQGDTLNLATWNGTGIDSYSLTVSAGVVLSTQPGGSIY